jgi:hypothetical protein
MLSKQVFCVVAPRGLVIASWRFEEAYRPDPQGNDWIHGLNNPEHEGDISHPREVAVPYKYLKILNLDILLRLLFFKVTVRS